MYVGGLPAATCARELRFAPKAKTVPLAVKGAVARDKVLDVKVRGVASAQPGRFRIRKDTQ